MGMYLICPKKLGWDICLVIGKLWSIWERLELGMTVRPLRGKDHHGLWIRIVYTASLAFGPSIHQVSCKLKTTLL